MLPKLNRIRKKKDFETIFASGKSFSGGFLSARTKKNNLSESRFGFVVSKKISPKAVVRNKIKRRLSEIIRIEIKKIKKGMDVVFIALPGLEKNNFSETKEEVKNILIKSGIFI